jgi:pimeloyl-ACP methyl ester carboxylesterase
MLSNILYGFLALFVFAAIYGVAYRFYRQGANRVLSTLAVPPGVQVGRFVRIGGIDQWITLRGENADNPVLLLLHGGPGNPMSGLAYPRLRPWEAHFTVAQWDQRGAGKTFGRHGKTGAGEMSLDQMVRDGIEVAECRKLNKDKIILLGLSWGSILGTEMVHRRPDLFSAYVGTGQVVDMKRGEAAGYDALMARLRARGKPKEIAALETIGPPPYPDRRTLIAERRLLFKTGSAAERATLRALPIILSTAPGVTLADLKANLSGALFSLDALYDAVMSYDIRRLRTRFEVPMIYLQGEDDIQTPTALVVDYVAEVEAPEKRLVLLGAGHLAILTHPEAFLAALVEAVGGLERAGLDRARGAGFDTRPSGRYSA